MIGKSYVLAAMAAAAKMQPRAKDVIVSSEEMIALVEEPLEAPAHVQRGGNGKRAWSLRQRR